MNALVARAWYRWLWTVREPARSEWLERLRAGAAPVERRDALVRRAAANVPFYRDALAGGPPAFERLPILTRRDLQLRRAALLDPSFPASELFWNQTGGSTGEPVAFAQSLEYRASSLASVRFGFELCGWRPGDRQLFIWGSDFDSKAHQGFKGRLLDRLENAVYLNAFALRADEFDRYRTILETFRPEFIWGYVSNLELFARLAAERGGLRWKPKAVQTTAELLTAAQRKTIEEGLGAPVFDRYGSRELGVVAHECASHAGLHVFVPLQHVEVLDEAGEPCAPGTPGRLVVTNLVNEAMPLLRYETGDWAAWSPRPCPCGLPWPTLEKLEGRRADFIVSPSGRWIHGEFFTHLFYKLEGVRQFQLVQETASRLRLRVVFAPGADRDAARRFLLEKIRDHGDAAFEVAFEPVERIEPSASGKLRFTMSRLDPLPHGPQT